MALSIAFQPALPLCHSLLVSRTNPQSRPSPVQVAPLRRATTPSLAQTFPKPNSSSSSSSAHSDQSAAEPPTTASASTPSSSPSAATAAPSSPSSPPSTTVSTPPSFSSTSDVPQVHAYPIPSGTHGSFAAVSREAQSIPDLFHRLSIHPTLSSSTALIDPHHTNHSSSSSPGPLTLTHAEYNAQVRQISAALVSLGLAKNDVVSLFSENSHRWGICDLAIMSCGAASAVRGASAPSPELAYIIEHSRSRALFVENVETLRHLLSACAPDLIADLKFIFVLFGSSIEASALLPELVTQPPVLSFDQVIRIGKSMLPGSDNDSGETELQINATRDMTASVLFTSGTTGNPKGVVLTHDNILRQLEHICLGEFDPAPGDVFVSILPCWHVFERTAAYWCLSRGMTLVYSNKRHFKADLSKYRPHILIAVPRVFENLHATIFSRLRSATAIRKALFAAFTHISLLFVQSRRILSRMTIQSNAISPLARLFHLIRMVLLWPLWSLAHLLIWKKIRAGLGGRVSICLSGGGSIATYLEDFFECANIPICVGYGLTETSPVIANRFSQRNLRGSTGMPLTATTVKLVDSETGDRITKPGAQGVLHVTGPSVFKGYLENEKATEAAFDSEGYFNTGDMAFYADGGDIVLCGRCKDIIVLSNGENIEPTAIEDAISSSSYIDQIMLVGQDKKSLGALVVPNFDQLVEDGVVTQSFVDDMRSKPMSMDEIDAKMTTEKQGMMALDVIQNEIKDRNMVRKAYCASDVISHVKVVATPFSVENGTMTQTLKLKKDVIAKQYEATIASMYEI